MCLLLSFSEDRPAIRLFYFFTAVSQTKQELCLFSSPLLALPSFLSHQRNKIEEATFLSSS